MPKFKGMKDAQFQLILFTNMFFFPLVIEWISGGFKLWHLYLNRVSYLSLIIIFFRT